MRKITEMPYIIGFVMRIYPSDRQKEVISKNAGAARFIYNRLVARDRELYSLRKVTIYCKPIANRIDYLESLGEKSTDLKAAYPFLEDKDIDSQMIANAIQNYHKAWDNFRKVPGTSKPTFHKKGYTLSYQTNPHYHKGARLATECNVHLDGEWHIQLPKIGRIRFKCSDRFFRILSRTCETRIGAICIHMNAIGEYYASFQIGSVCPFHKKMRKTGSTIGLDVNVENFYTDSDGNQVENPRLRPEKQRRIEKAQRRLSRRAERAKKEGRPLRGSKNYQKQRVKLAKLHLQVQRQREEFQHQESKKLIESQDAVFVEDLKVKNLLKNHCLAAAISDVAWGSFFHKLDYKSVFYGRLFRKVAPKNSTQECSACGHVMSGDEKLTLDVREWTCPACGARHVRDHNSAINIKNRGLALMPA